MRVIYVINGDLMVSIFDDISYYCKENRILFTSNTCDSIFVDADNDSAYLILFDVYEHGKVNLINYADKIKIYFEI